MSKKKNSRKKATVDFSVQNTRSVVKMNQPFRSVSARNISSIQKKRTIKYSPKELANEFPAVGSVKISSI